MSGYVEDPRQCEVMQGELAELALGILSGRSRSRVLAHVESCPRCTAELERLSHVADELIQLAPEVEPPLGFELRLAEKLRAAAPERQRRRRFWHPGVLSVAAAVIVLLGFGIGTLANLRGGNNQNQPPTANLTAATLTSHGHVLGEVMISAGSPAWMFMTIDDSAWSGTVTCAVTLSGGKVETIGAFKLSGGYGAWGAPLTSPAGKVQAARLIAPNGTILASAQLSA
jgi:anti-sigma factor RsiW